MKCPDLKLRLLIESIRVMISARLRNFDFAAGTDSSVCSSASDPESLEQLRSRPILASSASKENRLELGRGEAVGGGTLGEGGARGFRRPGISVSVSEESSSGGGGSQP